MDYEEYLRNVLGYNQVPSNIYTPTYEDYYFDMPYSNFTVNIVNNEMVESMYPEIYKMIYPMVRKVCMQNSNREITPDLVENMTEEIYSNIEGDETRSTIGTNTARPVLKNGDVRNPNAKEPELRAETRQRNYILRDLIKILILRELSNRPNRPGPINPRPPRSMRPQPMRPQYWY